MKNVVFKFHQLSDFFSFKNAVRLTQFKLDARARLISCMACQKMIKLAQRFNLQIISEEDVLEDAIYS